MPNHTSTILTITGTNEEIRRFIDASEGEDGAFSTNAFPMPEELRNTISPVKIVSQEERDEQLARQEKAKNEGDAFHVYMNPGITEEMYNDLMAKYGAADWYNWASMNWGTKWGFYDCKPWEVGEEQASVYYQTAWSPATAFFLKVSKDFALVFKHEFADEGGGFLGWEVISNGKITEKEYLDWNSTEGEELREKLGCLWESEYEEE